MATLLEQARKGIIKGLENDARRILQECVEERTYQHRSKNLYDSYGYGIYDRGRLIRSGYLSATPEASTARKWYGQTVKGREEIKDFLNNRASPKGSIALVIAAAMPYAAVLEAGGGNLRHSYKVISMSINKLQNISAKYGGTVKTIKG